ncbi:MAG: trypsin-like serine protease [bacterium]|nr:trypsin-like serine protease [bacterium]
MLARRRLALVVPLAAAWLVVASPAVPAADSAGSTSIHNGVPTAAYPAVGAVMVSFEGDVVGLCSGTLVASDVVLTAAHCLEGEVLDAGIYLSPNGVQESFHPGIGAVVHAEYRAGVAAWADIALLFLAEPVTDVTPLPWATAVPRPRTHATIVGFGADGAGGAAGTKREGEVRVKRCPKVFRRAGLAKGQLRTSICWKPKRRTSDTCRGDSGGPLIVGGAVAGLTSGGFPDCPGKLSWDTNVALFASWIQAAIDTVSRGDQ